MSALDDRIQAIVDAAILKERGFMRQVIAEVIADLQVRGGADDDLLAKLNDDVHELFQNRPDSRGIVRRQYFTPRDSDGGVRHGGVRHG
jgi:hypothetical protein